MSALKTEHRVTMRIMKQTLKIALGCLLCLGVWSTNSFAFEPANNKYVFTVKEDGNGALYTIFKGKLLRVLSTRSNCAKYSCKAININGNQFKITQTNGLQWVEPRINTNVIYYTDSQAWMFDGSTRKWNLKTRQWDYTNLQKTK